MHKLTDIHYSDLAHICRLDYVVLLRHLSNKWKQVRSVRNLIHIAQWYCKIKQIELTDEVFFELFGKKIIVKWELLSQDVELRLKLFIQNFELKWDEQDLIAFWKYLTQF